MVGSGGRKGRGVIGEPMGMGCWDVRAFQGLYFFDSVLNEGIYPKAYMFQDTSPLGGIGLLEFNKRIIAEHFGGWSSLPAGHLEKDVGQQRHL